MPERFLYETHLHTSEGSACSMSTGAELAEAHKAAGYAGMIVTNHFFYGNTAVDRSLPWEEWVRRFCTGYKNAKAVGDKIGLQVFFGWESCYSGTEFLIYGLDENWLLSHPEIKDCSIEEQYSLVKSGGGLVVHAHPFRTAFYIKEARLFPEYVDAVEGCNATHNSPLSTSHKNPDFDAQAREYAARHGLPVTAGSDTHYTNLFMGGMVFERRLTGISDFISAVRGREAVEYRDGTEAFRQ
ncbi:MAG: PHP domain-containing protein [Oscillospiraceae bacterium]|jgi:histidinol phosphatase-like PHP family hydrolase|nr:PHP domain-containing protein [Oscillospiraceae bacterium]